MVQQQVPSVVPSARSRRGEPAEFMLPPQPPRDPRLEDYLDRVMAPMVERVPYLERHQIRTEMAEHLDSLVAARLELAPDEDPVPAAMERFGKPQKVSRSWRAAVSRSSSLVEEPEVETGTFRDSVVLAAKCFGLAALPLWDAVLWTSGGSEGFNALGSLVGVGLIVLGPLAAGAVVGYKARVRPTRASLLVVGALIVLGHALANMARDPVFHSVISRGSYPGDGVGSQLSAFPMLLTFFWLALGSLGTGIGRWARPCVKAFRKRRAARLA